MTKAENATRRFESGFNCCQSILSTYCEEFGLDRTLALKMATAFGGGMMNLSKTCGVITGGLMVIGLKMGRTEADDLFSKEKTYDFAREFYELFKERHGSTDCKDLVGIDRSTEEGLKLAQTSDVFEKRCPIFIKDAIEILEDLL